MSMKVLVLTHETKEDGSEVSKFRWEDVDVKNSFTNGKVYFKTKYGAFDSFSVFGIKNDVRRFKKDRYVRCRKCGKIMRESQFEKHCEEQESGIKCADCRHADLANLEIINRKLKNYDKETGKAILTIEKGVEIYCNQNYNTTVNKDFDFRRYCIFYQCRTSGYEYLSDDFLSNHSMPYKKITTEKALYKNDWYRVNRNEYVYGKDNHLRAILENDLHIVTSFAYEQAYGGIIRFKYSDVYKTILRYSYGKLIEDEAIFPEYKRKKLLKAITDLYKTETEEK